MDDWSFHYLRQGSAAYEKARIDACWNGRVPDRYPRLIAFPECDQHVQQIVLYAKKQGLSIGTTSGGHSWTASFLRENGILVDLVKMKEYSFDVKSRTAVAQPAAYGSDLNTALLPHDLMFPAGHCPTVGLGGFLLQGGFGWNSRKWGLACESVLAVELVNSEGELICATSTQNSDYFWAARGAGCGYFGIITRFHLRLFELPKAIMTCRYVYPLEILDEVVQSIDKVSHKFPLCLEVTLFAARDQDGYSEPSIAIIGDALSETAEDAQYGCALLHDLPVAKKALKSTPFVSCTLNQMLKRYDDLLDNRGRRYEANNMWTDAPVQDLLPGLSRIIRDIPPAPSHLMLEWWLPQKARPDMAFSLEGRTYVALYGIGADPSRDQMHSDYVVTSLERMDKHRKGIQLADENLPLHPGKFMKTRNYQKLERLRQQYDPQGRFFSYIRVPWHHEQSEIHASI